MDCRKLHFGMIGIEIMTMCIHSMCSATSFIWLLYSLQVVPLVLVNVADN